MKKKFAGYTQNTGYDLLFNSLSRSITKLKRKLPTTIRRLVFFSKYKLPLETDFKESLSSSSEENSYLYQIIHNSLNRTRNDSVRVTCHELRHIFDHIIGVADTSNSKPWFVESQAYMSNYELMGFERDAIRRTEKITEKIEELGLVNIDLGIRQPNRDKSDLEYELNKLRDERSNINEFYDTCNEFVNKIPKDEWQALSYVISITPDKKVLNQLKEIAEHYK